MIREAIEKLVNGESLSIDQSSQAMDEIMSGTATPAQFGAFVTALRLKGETIDEIAGMAQTMRRKSLKVQIDDPVVDTCGTGGDSSHTFNISTTAGFVVAGTGIKVAKHGNRAMSGSCGSADVLESLGVNIELDPNGVEKCLNEVGYGFMFAQKFHPSMRYAAGPRKEIGIRSVFNILGPLTNPAGANAQLIGVANSDIAESIAKVLARLGSHHAMVVHGEDGLDEITLGDATQVWELKNGEISSYTLTPDGLGFKKVKREELVVHSPIESAKKTRQVLEGSAGPERDVVVVNSAATLLAADRVSSMEEGIALSYKSIDDGQAKAKLDYLITLSNQLK